ncbi:MAG: hypothetical protein ACI9DC_001256 [Gammaproteobacteria bacterium]
MNRWIGEQRCSQKHLAEADRVILGCKIEVRFRCESTGIKPLFSLTMSIEISDVKRFTHPLKLLAWASMDSCECASSDRSDRLGITEAFVVNGC